MWCSLYHCLPASFFPHPTNATSAIINRKYRMTTPYASRHACSRTDAGLFWTCIKIAKALREFDGEE